MNNVDHMFHPMFIVFHWHYHYSGFTFCHFTEIFKAAAIFGTVQSFISLNLQGVNTGVWSAWVDSVHTLIAVQMLTANTEMIPVSPDISSHE